MAQNVKEIVRRGRWMYDGTVPTEVCIVRQNYFEGPPIVDEEPTPGYPPRDENGMFYYVAYKQRGSVRSVSNLCGSAEEAAALAERTVQDPIVWD